MYVFFPSCILLKFKNVKSIKQAVETLLICSTCVLTSIKGLCCLYKRSTFLKAFAILSI